MLDLGLEHLGVDVGAADASVTAVLKACGESARLDLFSLTHLITFCSAFPAREPGDPMSSGQSRCTSRSAQEPCWYVPTTRQ
jgi:hypothetical protein